MDYRLSYLPERRLLGHSVVLVFFLRYRRFLVIIYLPCSVTIYKIQLVFERLAIDELLTVKACEGPGLFFSHPPLTYVSFPCNLLQRISTNFTIGKEMHGISKLTEILNLTNHMCSPKKKRIGVICIFSGYLYIYASGTSNKKLKNCLIWQQPIPELSVCVCVCVGVGWREQALPY